MEGCFYNSLKKLRSFTKLFEIYQHQLFRFQIDAEAATRGVLWEKVFLEISENSQENTCSRVSSVPDLFSSEISKTTFFSEHLRTTASFDDKSLFLN